MAAGRGRALRRLVARLRPRPERREERARERGRGRGGRPEAEGGGDGQGPRGRRSQGETLQHLSSEQHLVLARPFETFPQEQGLLGYPVPVGREALIGSHKTRCACRVNLRDLSAGGAGWCVEWRDGRRGGGGGGR